MISDLFSGSGAEVSLEPNLLGGPVPSTDFLKVAANRLPPAVALRLLCRCNVNNDNHLIDFAAGEALRSLKEALLREGGRAPNESPHATAQSEPEVLQLLALQCLTPSTQRTTVFVARKLLLDPSDGCPESAAAAVVRLLTSAVEGGRSPNRKLQLGVALLVQGLLAAKPNEPNVCGFHAPLVLDFFSSSSRGDAGGGYSAGFLSQFGSLAALDRAAVLPHGPAAAADQNSSGLGAVPHTPSCTRLMMECNNAVIATFSNVARQFAALLTNEKAAKPDGCSVVDLDIGDALWRDLGVLRLALQRLVVWFGEKGTGGSGETGESGGEAIHHLSDAVRLFICLLDDLVKEKDRAEAVAFQAYEANGRLKGSCWRPQAAVDAVGPTLRLCFAAAEVASVATIAVPCIAPGGVLQDVAHLIASIPSADHHDGGGGDDRGNAGPPPTQPPSPSPAPTRHFAVRLLLLRAALLVSVRRVALAEELHSATGGIQQQEGEKELEGSSSGSRSRGTELLGAIHAALVQKVAQFRDESVQAAAALLWEILLTAPIAGRSLFGGELEGANRTASPPPRIDCSVDSLMQMLDGGDTAGHFALRLVAESAVQRPHMVVPALFRLFAAASSSATTRQNILSVLAAVPALPRCTLAVRRRIADELLARVDDDALVLRIHAAAVIGRIGTDVLFPAAFSLLATRDGTGRRQAALQSIVVGLLASVVPAALPATIVAVVRALISYEADAPKALVAAAATIDGTPAAAHFLPAGGAPGPGAAVQQPLTPGDVGRLLWTPTGVSSDSAADPLAAAAPLCRSIVMRAVGKWATELASPGVVAWSDVVAAVYAAASELPGHAAWLALIAALPLSALQRGLRDGVLLPATAAILLGAASTEAIPAAAVHLLCLRSLPEGALQQEAPATSPAPADDPPSSGAAALSALRHALSALLLLLARAPVPGIGAGRLAVEVLCRFPVADVLEDIEVLLVNAQDRSAPSGTLLLSALFLTCNVLSLPSAHEQIQREPVACSRFHAVSVVVVAAAIDATARSAVEDAKLARASIDTGALLLLHELLLLPPPAATRPATGKKAVVADDEAPGEGPAANEAQPSSAVGAVLRWVTMSLALALPPAGDVDRVMVETSDVLLQCIHCAKIGAGLRTLSDRKRVFVALLTTVLEPVIRCANVLCRSGDAPHYRAASALGLVVFNLVVAATNLSPTDLLMRSAHVDALWNFAVGCARFERSDDVQFVGVKMIGAMIAVAAAVGDTAQHDHHHVAAAVSTLEAIAAIHRRSDVRGLAESIVRAVEPPSPGHG